MLTFIIPTIGRDTLHRTIESLEKQTNNNWNAIVIFDGCNPTIEPKNDKIKIMQIEKSGIEQSGPGNRYAGAVRNEGIKVVTTEWIAFVDDDDTLSSNYVETFYNELSKFNNSDVIIFRMSYEDDSNLILPPLNETNNFHNCQVGISFALKKKFFDLGYNFIQCFNEDFLLLNRIRENNYKIMISPYIRYFVRCNEYIPQTNNTIVGSRVFINGEVNDFIFDIKNLVNYYINNKNEFIGESGHEKLLVGLKKYIKNIDDSNVKIVGIDVGSCVGDYLENFNDICTEKNKKILCFEPNPVNILELEPKINKDKHFKLFTHCISNETTRTSFYNWRDSHTNNTGNLIAGLRSGGVKICDVDVKKLDDVLDNEFENENIIIKFIKIDTEGNDSNVIKGLKKYLSKTKYIIFECSDCLDDIRGPGIKNPMKDVVDFLSENGFDTYRIGTKKLFKVNKKIM